MGFMARDTMRYLSIKLCLPQFPDLENRNNSNNCHFKDRLVAVAVNVFLVNPAAMRRCSGPIYFSLSIQS